MTRILRGGWLIALAALGLFSVGCGPDGKKVVKVSGLLTLNGKPVPNAILHFEPSSGRPSWGMTNSEGRYTLKYTIDKEGAEVDTHKVWLEFPPATPQEENDLATGKKQLPVETRAMAKKYGNKEKPEIEVAVTGDGKDIEIKLD